MLTKLYRSTLTIGLSVATVALAAPCSAHFLWLKSIDHEGKPHAFLHFGENIADEAYHFPEKLAKIKLWRRAADVDPGAAIQVPLLHICRAA